MNIDLTPIIAPFLHEITTKTMVVGSGTLKKAASLFQQTLPPGKWLLLQDQNTRSAAGATIAESAQALGLKVVTHTLSNTDGDPLCDDATVDAFQAIIEKEAPSAVIAVGAGTINDVAKMASHRAGVPYGCFGTSPSMNGYTSGIAAILSDGVKTTQPCTPPIVCICDAAVMANSPARMIASGYGDLLSKPVSNADWRLAHRLNGAFHSDKVMTLVDAGSDLLDGIAPGLAERDEHAVARLSAALLVSGIAMSVAGSSAPASGGEHLISHYLDMTHFAFGESHDFHGCQVGVGTISAAALYERLVAMKPEEIDIDRLVAEHASWEDNKERITERFGVLTGAVVPHAKSAYPDKNELRRRLGVLKAEFHSIMEDVGKTLEPARAIRQKLSDAGCPTTFADIGVTDERARRAMVLAKDIRARYTILHLAAELGKLETWSEEILADLHGVEPSEA